MTKRAIIDCDPGLDDAIALILASRFAGIVGITTVTGSGRLHMSTQNALRMCDLIGLDVPVHQGSSRPLLDNVVHALEIHGADGLGDLDLPFSTRQAPRTDAVSYLLELTNTDSWVKRERPESELVEEDFTVTVEIDGGPKAQVSRHQQR